MIATVSGSKKQSWYYTMVCCCIKLIFFQMKNIKQYTYILETNVFLKDIKLQMCGFQ